mgnify:CR=1 FL=1
MWHALRTEIAYFRPWLLGGLGMDITVTDANGHVTSTVYDCAGQLRPDAQAPGILPGKSGTFYRVLFRHDNGLACKPLEVTGTKIVVIRETHQPGMVTKAFQCRGKLLRPGYTCQGVDVIA